MKRICSFFALYGFLSVGVLAQEEAQTGINLGGFVLRPSVSGSLVYDDRLEYNEATDSATHDVYAETTAGGELSNQDAQVNVSVRANYGYRYYDDYVENNDDFYNAGGEIGSDAYALRWRLATDVAKMLGYTWNLENEAVNNSGSIISDEVNTQWTLNGNLDYTAQISEKTAFVPSYSVQHYYQEFEGSDTAEWQTHQVSLISTYGVSQNTIINIGGYYSMQVNDDEDGSIAVLGGGFDTRITDKTSASLRGGVGYADYDLSGSDTSGLIDLQMNWQATPKLALYVSGGNTYEPGYGGGEARMLYRVGYGASWLPTSRFSIGGSVLHNYEDGINGDDDSIYGSVQHFFTLQCGYDLTRRLNLALIVNYANDQEPVSRSTVSLRLLYMY
ncbi:hypothetical protein [Pontiella agarivorans]|uniref:Porin n=1 Tax=Pontiella agarivorans TaxID=3038953 RepID=A0ABU5MU63_9BACT|nr:hypothetical protein [Pontiella agarivorans]MDZ8117758.1 hypothetical protein [Pontiella agarivorans]